MKRETYTALIIMLCMMFPFSAHSAVKGDVYHDGKINLKDAMAALRILSGIQDSADTGASVDGSGRIGIADAIYALQYTARLRSIVAATGIIGEAGGTVEVTDASSPIRGAKVIVPDGATEAGESVTIEIGYQDDPPVPLNTQVPEAIAAGKAIVLTKSGPLTFQKPVEVVWPYDDTEFDPGDMPSVLSWDEKEGAYVAAEVTAIDQTAKTVTFLTTHFSDFALAAIKGLSSKLLGSAFPPIPTGFRPEVDGFFHPNDAAAYNVGLGACAGMSSYAIWYYAFKKAQDGNGLYAKYRQGVIEDPADDKIARELLIRAALASSHAWLVVQRLIGLGQSITISTIAGFQIIQNMWLTGKPQMIAFNYSPMGRHAVVVHGYDGAGKFLIYDSNYPGKQVTVNWNPLTGFANYSDPPPDASLLFDFTHHGSPTFFKRGDFENLYMGAESGWTGPLFNTVAVASPVLDAVDSATLEKAPGENISIEGIVAGGSRPAKYLGYAIFRIDPKPNMFITRGVMDLTQAGGFQLTRSYVGGTYWIFLLATDDRAEASNMRPHAYAGMKQITLKVTEKPAALLGTLELPDVARAVQVSGSNAYVIDTNFGLRVVDVSNAASPSLKTSLSLSPYKSGRGVAISGSYAYAAIGKMQIIDIGNPEMPVMLGGAPSGDASDIEVVGSVAYVAGGGSSTPLTGALFSFDVSDPANLFKDRSLSGINFPGSDIRAVAVSGTYVHAFDPIGGWLYVIDISNPSAIKISGQVNVGGSDSILCGIHALGDRVYVINKNKFAIVDVSKPAEPAVLSSMASSYGRDVSVTGTGSYRRAYLLGADYLASFEVTDPGKPYFLSSQNLALTGVKIAVSNGKAYIASSAPGGKGALAVYQVE
jgi:hypothetical protein